MRREIGSEQLAWLVREVGSDMGQGLGGGAMTQENPLRHVLHRGGGWRVQTMTPVAV